MPILADKAACTGCGACMVKCLKGCITLVKDDLDNLYPNVDEAKCIECKQCESACPVLFGVESLVNKPNKAYAAWSNNEKIRMESASGGAAAELYRCAQKKGYLCYGVVLNDDWTATFTCASADERAEIKFQNSKYTYSEVYHVLPEIKHVLQDGEKVFIVGLPCQIAAIKKYLGKEYSSLVTADLLCHGVCSNDYLKQHIATIEKSKTKKGYRISFRDPNYATENCCFTVVDKDNKEFYHKMVNEDDTYQLGYHHGVIYRENCYQCRYATVKRTGDLMLGDYWLLGRKIPFSDSIHNVSLIYTMTVAGETFLQAAVESDQLIAIERPVEEAVEVQAQLNGPTRISPEHRAFVKKYIKTHDFEISAEYAMKKDLLCNKLKIQKLLRIYKKARRKILKG